MKYISNTKKEREEMLSTVGVERIEEIFSAIPDEVMLDRPLKLPAGISEPELMKEIKNLAEKNVTLDEFISFLGGGAYDHYIPALIDHLILRSEYYTAYTPYQAELSQGTLQAIYEYQSMICELTGMDVANASLLDGGSATGEAALMAGRVTRKKKILISSGVNPAYRNVASTYGRHQKLELHELKLDGTETDLNYLQDNLDQDTAAVIIQYPNFFGSLEKVNEINKLIKAQKRTLLIVVANPIALGVLKPPSEFGADIVIGEGQPLGNSINYGGPYLGFMACKKKYTRQLPGRIVGATTDIEGEKGYVLTLQTREQHIRREKATSNICTNEALNALIATIYLAALGKNGIKETAEQSLKKAHYLAERLEEIDGVSVLNSDQYFHEFLLQTELPASTIIEELLKEGIMGGIDISRFDYDLDGLLVCVTEKRNKDELDKYASSLEVVVNG